MPSISRETDLIGSGFARYDLAKRFGISPDGDVNYKSLVAEFEDLPADPYATEAGRFRRYGRGLYFPWSGQFTWIPAPRDQGGNEVNGYYQGDHNPEYVGMVRTLPAISETARTNPLLLDILQFNFQQTRWNEVDSAWPMHVGVHLIKLSVEDAGEEAISSPNELHQDGEPFVFAHLIYRRNAVGGRNVIAPPRYRGLSPKDVPPDELMAEFELTEPLESYAITDAKVSHYVAPIMKGAESVPGERAVVLVDVVPMRQKI
ncbi:2OG-Fe dioxygenase family protein [Micromonospora aurantiaca]|uniref:2OG-Fe dioxygenase family protein n=1 Tax=Micromonospora aurantiaca (nom. illeg.) TaxID=47850 RepID=UPI0033B8ADDD